MAGKGKEPFWVISLIIRVILTNSDIVEFSYILLTTNRSGKNAFYEAERSQGYSPLSSPWK